MFLEKISNLYFSCISGTLYKKYKSRKRYKKNYREASEFLQSFPCPELTDTEKNEIDVYWKQYGIKFPDYSWFQMYYGVTGIKDPRFIPNTLASILYYEHNRPDLINAWDDKNIYQEIIPQLRFPDSLCHYIHGVFYDSTWKAYKNDKASLGKLSAFIWENMGSAKDIVFKIASGTFAGKGVKKIHVESAQDIEAFLLANTQKDYILQKCVVQHPFLAQFNESSVNIFRIITFRVEERIELLSVSMRYGPKGSFTDVAYIDGKEVVNVLGITQDGYVKKNVSCFNGQQPLDITLDDDKVPSFDALINAAIEGHKKLYYFNLVGWDFTIDTNGNPICIEYNIAWPGNILYQYANGPFAGPLTEEFLKPLKDKTVQKKYPRFLRANG